MLKGHNNFTKSSRKILYFVKLKIKIIMLKGHNNFTKSSEKFYVPKKIR